MATRERPADRGRRIARLDRQRAGAEIRAARERLGHSLVEVARAAGISAAQAGRIERAELRAVRHEHLVRLGAAVGLDIRLRAYPGPDPIRDAAQARLLGRLRATIHPALSLRLEVPLPGIGDQRAWDAVIAGFVAPDDALHLPAEAETRLTDAQAQFRRIGMKARDAGSAHLLIVVADTHRNRAAMREVAPLVTEMFPVDARHALAALRAGRYPCGSAIILL